MSAWSIPTRGPHDELVAGFPAAVYEGMVIGENARENDLDVNICKEKKPTIMSSAFQ